MKKDLRFPPFKSGTHSHLCSPVIQGFQVPLSPFPNGEMDEGYIWVWSTMQTNRKQTASSREDFMQ